MRNEVTIAAPFRVVAAEAGGVAGAAPETTHAVVHAATFPLPRERGDYGDGAVQRMSDTDVFVALVEFHPA